MVETYTLKVQTNEEGYFEAFIELKGPGINNIWCEAQAAGGAPQTGWAKLSFSESSCTAPACAGVGNVVAGNAATITVSDTNGAPDDNVNLLVNGIVIGLVPGGDPAVPTTFNGVTINLGSNIIRLELVPPLVSGTSKQITVVSGGQTVVIVPANLSTDYTVCGVCA